MECVESGGRREDVAPVHWRVHQAGLHRWRPGLSTALQRPVRPDDIVRAAHEVDVPVELVGATGVAGRAPAQVRRALANREVETLDERGVQGLGILRLPPRSLQPTRRAPLSQVAALAEQYSHEDPFATVHHQPFQGLVQTRPRRALIALRLEMRHGRLHRRLWSSLLNGWPPGTSERLLAVCGGRLVSLADKDLIALRSEVARWCREHSPRLVPKYSSLAWFLTQMYARFWNDLADHASA